MASILDVAPVVRSVKTAKYGDLEVNGLSLEGIVSLAKEHPALIDIFKAEDTKMTLDQILSLGMEIVASFLAAGLGYPGNKPAKDKCRKMNAQDAFDIGQAIIEESFPGGAESFFEKVTAAANSVGLKAVKEKGLDQKSKPSSKKQAA